MGALAVSVGCATTPPIDVGRIPPDVDVIARTRYYVLSGATIPEIGAEMRTVGPFAEGGQWAGAAQARTRWTFGYRRVAMVCSLYDVRVIVNVEIRLPRWQPQAEPDSATLAWWDELSASLVEHERGHVRIAVDGAREIAATLRPLEASGSCDGLGMRANGAAQAILALARERQAEYDRVTGHGRRQTADSARGAP